MIAERTCKTDFSLTLLRSSSAVPYSRPTARQLDIPARDAWTTLMATATGRESDFPETAAPRRFDDEHISRLHLDTRDVT